MITRETKVKTAGGLGLSAAAVMWMFATFALQRDLAETRVELREACKELRVTRERLMVVDTIVMNKQLAIAERYE